MIENTFCSSPWYHIKLANDGSFRMCRWGKKSITDSTATLKTHSIMQFYNSNQMRLLRQQLLSGESPEICSTCYYEQSFGKLNGRHRQLNKSAIDVKNFALTTRSSPHFLNFKYSYENNGYANMHPVDIQVDLGNTCNSACIMCDPASSSRLQVDYKKLHIINPRLFQSPYQCQPWTKDPVLVDQFINQIGELKNLKYIHFLGGETLYESSFYDICDKLIELGMAENIIVGTTTNGTIYNEKIELYIEKFKEFHLGISIESVTSLNDYIRYPSNINEVLDNTNKFLLLRDQNSKLYISLRITPNIFSIYEIDKLFTYMLENNVIAESCNILFDPPSLRIELLPEDIRNEIKNKIFNLINYYELSKSDIVNIRRNDIINHVIANVILDYYKFICEYTIPDNVEELRYDLVNFVKGFESIRQNSIIKFLPNYENFLRHYGY